MDYIHRRRYNHQSFAECERLVNQDEARHTDITYLLNRALHGTLNINSMRQEGYYDSDSDDDFDSDNFDYRASEHDIVENHQHLESLSARVSAAAADVKEKKAKRSRADDKRDDIEDSHNEPLQVAPNDEVTSKES